MRRATGLVLALALGFGTGCAGVGARSDDGPRPRDNQHTRAAGVAIAQATMRSGDEARGYYQEASDEALRSIEAEPENPRGYLLAGQAAVGLQDFVQADTMFDRAVAMYPRYADQVDAERFEGWVETYDMGVMALEDGDLEQALAMFTGADILYQETHQARMAMAAVNLRLGRTDDAITAFERALEILYGDPPAEVDEELVAEWYRDRRVATFNMAQLMAQAGRFDEAADVMARYMERFELEPELELEAVTAQAGFLAQAGRAEEAEAVYSALLDRDDLGYDELFQIGVGFFNTGDYVRAAAAFEASAEHNPQSRDAYLNLVQSLYSAATELERTPQSAARDDRLRTMYTGLIAAAERVQSFDPFNRNLLSFTLRAYRGQADLATGAAAQRYAQQTQDIFRAYQAQEYEVSDITLTPTTGTRAQLSGLFTNLSGTPGQQVTLRFNVLNVQGNALRTVNVPIRVPPVDTAAEFQAEVDLAGGFAGWRYELVQ